MGEFIVGEKINANYICVNVPQDYHRPRLWRGGAKKLNQIKSNQTKSNQIKSSVQNKISKRMFLYNRA